MQVPAAFQSTLSPDPEAPRNRLLTLRRAARAWLDGRPEDRLANQPGEALLGQQIDVAAVAMLAAMVGAITAKHPESDVAQWLFGVLVLCLALEGAKLWRAMRGLPIAVRTSLNILFYAAVITALMVKQLQAPDPQVFAQMPASVVAYGLVILAAALRNDPRLCLIGGAAATAGLCGVALVARVAELPEGRAAQVAAALDNAVVVVYGGLLAVLTFLAAVLAQRGRELRRLSFSDGLTRVANRHAFDACAAEAIDEARRGDERVALAMIDVDRFKALNDTHGHETGDAALRWLGGLLRDRFRTTDLVARVGGEEFAVVLPAASRLHLARRAEALQREVAAHELSDAYGNVVRLDVSIGVASFPDDGDDLAEILRNADRRLYEAKRSGRGRVFASG